MNSKIDRITLVYVKDKRLLSARDKGKDKFYIPGGKREEGETEEEALIREIKEELDVDLILNTLKPMGVFERQAHGRAEGTIVRLICYTGEFTGNVNARNEIEEVAWLSYSEKEKYPKEFIFLFDLLKDKGLL
jgi:8-oxo-dGTP diphosphatase